MILEARQICKRFGEVVALDRVDFSVAAGEIHAVLGENGAGKSTLMNLLYGLTRPDSGEIFWEGRPVQIKSPRRAMRLGISMVHQHFMLSPSLTVAENVALALPQGRRFFFSRRKMIRHVARLAEKFSLQIDPEETVGELSVGEQQRVEILKAVARDVKLLILDEPTSLLTPQETQELFQIFRRLREAGQTIIFITHKLEEVKQLCDRATVLRQGKGEGTCPVAATPLQELAAKMIGRSASAEAEKQEPRAVGIPRLRLKGVSADSDRKKQAIRDINLELREGEVVGVVGVEGNGQRELVEVALGLRPPRSGKRAAFVNRIGYIPADRRREGLILPFTIGENFLLEKHFLKECSRWAVLRRRQARRFAQHLMRHYAIAAPGETTTVARLSGGNQQKVVVARELGLKSRLLVAVNPTWGLDIEATAYVRRQLNELRSQKVAILLVTIDLDEALQLSDRLFVIYNGQLREIPKPDWNHEKLGLYMTGITTSS